MKVSALVARIARKFIELIKWYKQRGMSCFERQATLSRRWGVSARTVRKAIQFATCEGLLKVIRRGPTSAVYELATPAPGHSPGHSFAPPISITESHDSVRRERTEEYLPTVVFLRSRGSAVELAQKRREESRMDDYVEKCRAYWKELKRRCR